MKQRFIFKPRKDGTIRRILVTKPLESRRDLEDEAMTFHQRVLKAYHEVDCNGGYRGAYPPRVIKKLHGDAIARGE